MPDLVRRKEETGQRWTQKREKIRSHEQLHRCSSSFCFPAQGCAGAPPGSTRCPCSSERVPRGEKGSARAVTSRELGVARETAHSVLEASFWGCCFSPHWFCIPTAPANSIKPQTAEQQPQDTRQHTASSTASERGRVHTGARGTQRHQAVIFNTCRAA